MSLPRYGEYKASGFSWATELPAHWESASLKWCSQRYSGGTPDKNRLEFWEDGTIPWLNSGAVNDGRIHNASAYITQEAFENSSAKWIPPGALVMALAGQGKTKGMVAQLMFESTCNQSMAAIVPNDRINARCLYWWLVCNYQNIRNMAGGDLRDGLNLDLLGAIPCPLPPLAEQATIAAFLDHETNKIDALIAEQEKLIALLAEKRQATISHAVTRGLNPDAPMKYSGVPWLGEVPAHWVVGPLKHFVRQAAGAIKTGPFGSQLTAAEMESGSIKVYNQRNVIDADFLAGDNYISEEKFQQLASFEAMPGDVLITTRGTVGRAAILPDDAERGILHPCLLRVQVDRDRLDARYLQQLIQGSGLLAVQIALMSNATTIEVIYSQTMAGLVIPVPMPSEQTAILRFIDAECAKLDALLEDSVLAVHILKERRSALIAAAVTGQIDVRGFVAPPPPASEVMPA
jgi:type I restriction enzyme S subunit